MYDLLYMEEREYHDQIKADLAIDFPMAKFENASDFIHQYRFSIDVDGIEQKDWYLWLLRKGWFQFSFDFQLTKMDKPEVVKPLMLQVIEERKQAASAKAEGG